MIIGFYDTETKKNPSFVGWRNYKEMGMSIGCITIVNTYTNYEYTAGFQNPDKLADQLNQLDLVVGFNNYSFDDNLICALAGRDQDFLLHNYDILEDLEVRTDIKYVTALNPLIIETINQSKISGVSGDQVPELYRQGKTKQIEEYCKQDCKTLKELFFFGVEYGYVLIKPNKNGNLFGDLVLKIPVNWAEIIH